MLRFLLLGSVASAAVAIAAPAPTFVEARTVVAGLSSPSVKVRDDSAAALRHRPDALPWLRRAARSRDQDTVRRANELLAPSETLRQDLAVKTIDACAGDGRADLFMEWFHYWHPKVMEDLWSTGPRAAKAGIELFAKISPPNQLNPLELRLGATAAQRNHTFHSGSLRELRGTGPWHIRTDDSEGLPHGISFAHFSGHARLGRTPGGHFFALGDIRVSQIQTAFVVCDGSVEAGSTLRGTPYTVKTGISVVICRGQFFGEVGDVVLLVDGDVDLSETPTLERSLIRATGEIRLPKNVKPVNCTIEANVKNATAPYKFFELADVGVSLADDEEGLVVTAVKANTPFGNCGLAKGDLIRAIDDAPAGHSEEFRRKVRRALVRQGDCLLTVTRGDKTVDLPVFFPLPK